MVFLLNYRKIRAIYFKHNYFLFLYFMNYKIGLLFVSLVLFSGCGDAGPKLYHISGEVTYDGKPVPEGMIYFTPNSSAGERGAQGLAFILNGKYNTLNGRGVSSGPVSVVISGSQRLEGKEEATILFDDYIEEFEIPNQNTVKNFDVPSNVAKRQ
jgi:hypothetical protein